MSAPCVLKDGSEVRFTEIKVTDESCAGLRDLADNRVLRLEALIAALLPLAAWSADAQEPCEFNTRGLHGAY